MADASVPTPPTLVVIVPGLGKTRTGPLKEKILALDSSYRVNVYEHGVRWWSFRRTLEKVVGELASQIRDWAGENRNNDDPPTEIVLIGHSIGGLFARAAFLRAGGFDGALQGRDRSAWPAKVTRIVLLGSPNSGYKAANLPKSWGWLYPAVSGLGNFTVESVQEGAYWLANLRLAWLSTMRELWAPFAEYQEACKKAQDAEEPDPPEPEAPRPPLVVQVYGTRDGIVTADDIDDSKYLQGTVRREMFGANHAELIDLSDLGTAETRWEVIKDAITSNADDADEYTQPSPEPVYFILHGIRASAYDGWVANLTNTLQLDPGDQNAVKRPRVVALNYKFFSAIEFALPFTRRRNIHQFLDQYMLEVLTHSPDGFNFMGHSNGTYMMATVMRAVRAVRFRRIMLAGSVLPPDFNWQGLFDQQQIGFFNGVGWVNGEVHNDRARVDVPVGMLANGLRVLGFRDIGAGGFRGFEGVTATGVTSHSHTFPKGHGAALVSHVNRKHNLPDYPPRMPEIVKFLTTDTICSEPLDETSKGFSLLSRLAPVIAIILAAGLLFGLYVGFVALLGAIGLGWTIVIYIAGLALIYIGLRTV